MSDTTSAKKTREAGPSIPSDRPEFVIAPEGEGELWRESDFRPTSNTFVAVLEALGLWHTGRPPHEAFSTGARTEDHEVEEEETTEPPAE